MIWFVYTVVGLAITFMITCHKESDFEAYEVELGLRDPDTWEII